MKTNLDLANTVSRVVELRAINLRTATVSSNLDHFSEIPPELIFSQQYRASYEIPEGVPDVVGVTVDLNLMAQPPDVDIPTVSLNASFFVAYGLPSANEHPSAALEAFAELNGLYHVWPYWRELVHTVTGRVGLAPFVISVLKLPVKPLDEESEPTTKRKPRSSGSRVRKRKPPTQA
jgi:hypothetical protein